MPVTGLRTTCSIFIDSSTTTTVPDDTGAPDGNRQQHHRSLEGRGQPHLLARAHVALGDRVHQAQAVAIG